MKAIDIPDKFPIIWAADAGGSYIRPIPEASQIGIEGGAASLTDGFVPLNFTPRSAGGVPPFGEDMNGILQQITAWSQWQNAGATVAYDSDFSTSIGGYPKGAVLASTTAGNFWYNSVDDNTTDPDGVGAENWNLLGLGGIQAQAGNYAVDTGAANAYVVALAPVLLAHTPGLPIRFKVANTNTGPSTFNPGPGIKNLVNTAGSALLSGQLQLNKVYTAVYNGVAYQVQEVTPLILQSTTTVVPNDGSAHVIANIGSNGSQLFKVAGDYGGAVGFNDVVNFTQFQTPGVGLTVNIGGGVSFRAYGFSGTNLTLTSTGGPGAVTVIADFLPS